ncbi:MAG TPA: LptF/LptG family permease, partial [Sphingomonas sp.]|uniref:LptF/LptG family permease n=1 Tax=Sphingomonas sp. TaxID=28214 RepID=UPI002ED81D41
PRVLSFVAHDLPIDLPKMDSFRQRGGRDREMTIPELSRVSRLPATTPATRNALRAEYHFRLVEVATMFLLPLLAVALAVPPKRSSSALGVFLAIVLLVTQHKINEYASALGTLGRVDPILALWIPFLAFAGLTWWMYHMVAHVPGGQPIGALERVFAKIGATVRRWTRRRNPDAVS